MLKKTWNRDRDPWIGQAVKTINTRLLHVGLCGEGF